MYALSHSVISLPAHTPYHLSLLLTYTVHYQSADVLLAGSMREFTLCMMLLMAALLAIR